MFDKVVVAQSEVVIAKKAVVGRQGRGVCRAEHKVARAVDYLAFLLCIAAPEYEHEVLALGRELAYDGIGKCLPAMAGMRGGLVLAHSEGGVEQQHALLSPAAQTACGGHGTAGVGLNLLEYVDQRRGHAHTVFDRETQTFSLSGTMVGVLANDDDLYLREGAEIEGVEYLVAGRIARALGIFVAHKVGELLEVGCIELALQLCGPRGVYLYIHNVQR